MSRDPLIMVIDGPAARGTDLKELIEFMDAPSVRIANCDDWREQLGERRLAAVFVGDDLARAEMDRLIREVGELDPNAPIVRVSASGTVTDSNPEDDAE